MGNPKAKSRRPGRFAHNKKGRNRTAFGQCSCGRFIPKHRFMRGLDTCGKCRQGRGDAMPEVFPQNSTSDRMYRAFYRTVADHVPLGKESQLTKLLADRPGGKVFLQDITEASCDPACARRMGFQPKRAWKGSTRDLLDLLRHLLGVDHPATKAWKRQLNTSHEKGSKRSSRRK